MTMPSSQGRRGPSLAKSFSVLTNTNQCPTAMETAVSLNRQKRRFQPVCCVKATPVLQSRCCRERRCRGFSIRPETKEGPFVLKCADRLEGEGGNGRTNRCGPHRRFVSMAKRRGSRRRIRCVKRGARFGERFEGRRSEPGVFFSYRTGMKVRKGCGRRKGASLWVGLNGFPAHSPSMWHTWVGSSGADEVSPSQVIQDDPVDKFLNPFLHRD